MSWGNVQIKVVKARGLAKMDTFGLSDPFAVLKLGGSTHKTRVIPKTLNPIWDEEFTYEVSSTKDELVVNLFDRDRFFRNEFMGTVTLPVSKFQPGTYTERWYKLEKRKARSNVQGDILLGVLVTKFLTAAEKAQIQLAKQESDNAISQKKKTTGNRPLL